MFGKIVALLTAAFTAVVPLTSIVRDWMAERKRQKMLKKEKEINEADNPHDFTNL